MKPKSDSLLRNILHGIAGSRYIMFESAPDLSDNTKAVFDEMLRRGLNKKYTFLWLLFDERNGSRPEIENVKYIRPADPLLKVYRAATKCFISCNRFGLMGRFCTKGQFAIFLDHGSPLKDVSAYMKLPSSIDCCLSASEGFVKGKQEMLGIKEPQEIVPLGFPRNDVFSKAAPDLHRYFSAEYKKIIVWYPTFRQNKNDNNNRNESDIALPLIHDLTAAVDLNEYARKRNVMLVLKPHFAQDVSLLTDYNLSNIVFIDDAFYKKNGISSYEFLNGTDALLSDYSSVYYDYTLHDRPIGLIWEDIEEYKSRLGLVEGYEELTSGGVKIYDLKDLFQFIDDVANGVDTLKDERRKNRDYSNFSTDGKNSERVVDYIMNRAKL